MHGYDIPEYEDTHEECQSEPQKNDEFVMCADCFTRKCRYKKVCEEEYRKYKKGNV